jgi:hypothetical protein
VEAADAAASPADALVVREAGPRSVGGSAVGVEGDVGSAAVNWQKIVDTLHAPPVDVMNGGMIRTRCMRCDQSVYWSVDFEVMFVTAAEIHWAYQSFVQGHQCGVLPWER